MCEEMPDNYASQPSARPPPVKAPGVSFSRSDVSFSSVETLTPESSNGGRPSQTSRVSASRCTISPSSLPSYADLGDRISYNSKVPSWPVGADASSRDPKNVFVRGASLASLDSLQSQSASSSANGRVRPAELRRRKYAAPGDQLSRPRRVPTSARGTPPVPASLSQLCQTSGGSSTPASSSADDVEVLVEGPLQQRAFLVFWRWRWCVLDRQELRIYSNEEASLMNPFQPLERIKVGTFCVAPDLHFASMLLCSRVPTGDTFMFLRTGPGIRWEEVVASSLWLRAFNIASRASPLLEDPSLQPRRSGSYIAN